MYTDYINQARRAAASVYFVSNQAFAGERGYFDASALSKPLLHTWSLAIEGYSYLFLSVAVMLVHRYFRPHILAIAVQLASLAWCLDVGRTGLGAPFCSLLTRSLETLAGSALAMAPFAQAARAAAKIGTLAGLVPSITLLARPVDFAANG